MVYYYSSKDDNQRDATRAWFNFHQAMLNDIKTRTREKEMKEEITKEVLERINIELKDEATETIENIFRALEKGIKNK